MIELLGVVQQEVHHHEDGEERGEEQVGHCKVPRSREEGWYTIDEE
jgi:hypothetical protein